MKILQKMLSKTDKNPQLEIFKIPLKHFIKDDHELVLLSQKVDWDQLEKDLSVYYCHDNGRPGIAIRTIVGILLLKRIFNESDESVLERWPENPYWQFFCGETYFQHDPPFDRTELIKFRHRIGDAGAEKILKASILIFPIQEVEEKEASIDSTVQEKNITYPTDTKLQKKIIEQCRKIAAEEGIQLRQSYKRILKQLMIDQRFRDHPKRKKKANAAARKIKTIAGRVVRDLERKFNDFQKEEYEERFLIFNQILKQEKSDKNKIYSIHEPHVRCIAKGKEAKKYEFGNKTSIVRNNKSGVIIGAMSFICNLYDGDTLAPQLEQIQRLTLGHKPRTAVVDRGYRGKKHVLDTEIKMPGKLPASANNYQKQKIRKQFRARAAIEPIIGHLKHDHRMGRNFLSGNQGDAINTIMAAAAFNMRKMLLRIKSEVNNFIIEILNIGVSYKLQFKNLLIYTCR